LITEEQSGVWTGPWKNS